MTAIGSDPGRVERKNFVVELLRAKGVQVRNFATQGRKSVDYPDFGREVSLRVFQRKAERVLICPSGIGMSIVVNKFPGIRAALVQGREAARVNREHNHPNILVLRGAKSERSSGQQILDIRPATSFAGGRHQRRLDKITQIEHGLGIPIGSKAQN
jgi:ribose 5-phosphate isomerase B